MFYTTTRSQVVKFPGSNHCSHFFMFNELVHLEYAAKSFLFFIYFYGKSYNIKELDSKGWIAGVGHMWVSTNKFTIRRHCYFLSHFYLLLLSSWSDQIKIYSVPSYQFAVSSCILNKPTLLIRPCILYHNMD